jgi:hypothetical protein
VRTYDELRKTIDGLRRIAVELLNEAAAIELVLECYAVSCVANVPALVEGQGEGGRG